ncbi:MAG: beta-ketoacyl-[acyl-carrier-protein] synthase family protein [Proteobacteria bacterium]|nr:beta-ketoacyl-[acyl-carrier-protein] synthase family protein [Pseudomonadota bacterium]
MTPLAVTAFTATTAVGVGNETLARALRDARGGLRANDFTAAPLATHIGRVDGVEALDWPAEFAEWECRNNRLAWLGLGADGFREAVAAARRRHGPARVALVVGTSTSSIGASEEAYARLGPGGLFPPDLRRAVVHQPHSLGAFLAAALGLDGPCVTVSTACSSSAKVFAYAERLLRLGLADAAVVGGVDTLCGSVLFGFNSLALVSAEPCRPFDVARNGISIGEAAGFALLERDGEARAWFIGHGESSDAHHMSSPHPEGLGARLALEAALGRAGLAPGDVDYINLHGTASQKNDEIEAAVLAALFPPSVAASSTKGWTGHTLGAAGVVEAVVCLLALRDGFRPGTLNATTLDPACGPQIRLAGERAPVRVALTESFGFGGNNCVLVFAGQRP